MVAGVKNVCGGVDFGRLQDVLLQLWRIICVTGEKIITEVHVLMAQAWWVGEAVTICLFASTDA